MKDFLCSSIKNCWAKEMSNEIIDVFSPIPFSDFAALYYGFLYVFRYSSKHFGEND
jgi:hypothetical protein